MYATLTSPMLPSSTVENYLKAIYKGTAALEAPQTLLPMGQLASALSVAPGTATTMVKTLAESGLVHYEPYAGVALTPAGERLAGLVLRRHRLIELFLVRVMGYSWDEVHDEAEHLEHVVSDRLVDRMDQMLGRPEVDPHGDPIPDADGLVKPQEAQSLLTCQLNDADDGDARHRSGQGVPALHRAAQPEAGRADRGGSARCRGRQRADPRLAANGGSRLARAPPRSCSCRLRRG